MSIVDKVKKIVGTAAKHIPGVEIIAPLPVWDNRGHSMGVQIKAPKQMGPQPCEMTASIVYSESDLRNDRAIERKAKIAVAAMLDEVQVKIVPKERRKVA